MSNTMRWRYGETTPVMLPVESGVSVEIGDLLFQESGFAKPGSTQTNQGGLVQNQEAFHDNFVGVAMQCTTGDGLETIRVATTGVFEFACAAGSYSVGDLIGIQADPTGEQLQNQQVASVTGEHLAIGRCVKHTGAGTQKVLVDITSTVVHGGPQVAA